MRAFITLRVVELIALHVGDVVLVGANNLAGTLRIKEFLTRNGRIHMSILNKTRACRCRGRISILNCHL